MPDFDQIGRALAGFGAGVQGRGTQFLQGLEQREQRQQQQQKQLSDQRRQAMLQDNQIVLDNLLKSRPGAAIDVLSDRIGLLDQLGADSSDTRGLLQLINDGKIDEAIQESTVLNDAAVIRGLIEPLPSPDKPKQQIVDGQLVTIGPDGAVASDIEGLREDTGAAEDRALRSRQLAVSEAAEKRQSGKLSAGLEKALLTSQDRVVEAQRNANEYEVLASDFERLNLEGGLASTFSETLKNVLGSQDQVSEFRRKFNQVRISQGIKNLPPGPASDVDVKMAMKGVPKESASAGQVASFLRGSSRIARFDAGYNQFKADFITQKRSGAGLNKSWRSSVQSPGLKRKVSIAEIYETAQNRGITPEDVAAQLGIKEALF